MKNFDQLRFINLEIEGKIETTEKCDWEIEARICYQGTIIILWSYLPFSNLYNSPFLFSYL